MPRPTPNDLEASLDRYAASSAAQRNTPTRSWLLYSAATGAALAAAPAAEAAIVYTDPADITINATAGYNPGPNFANSYIDFDLDGDLQNDLFSRI